MLLAIGTRVQLRFTGENGTVTGRLGDDMLQVRLDNDPDFTIPAFEEDLIRLDELKSASPSGFAALKKENKPEPPARRALKSQYHVLKPKGIQLAFEPMPGRDDTISRYKVWLINDTTNDFLIEFDLYTGVRDVLTIDDKLPAETALEMGDFLSDDLNDAPEVWLQARRITTAGPDEPLETVLRIRAKQFFNSLHTAPILNVLSHQFVLMEKFDTQAAASGADALREYARQQGRKAKREGNSGHFKAFDPEAFATFEPEIDLHIQNLMNGYARLDKGEILRIQMQHFQKFLDKALRLGVSRVFIIHGVGEGKLKDAIAERLSAHPNVRKFKNEYHHKYGYGATEVFLD